MRNIFYKPIIVFFILALLPINTLANLNFDRDKDGVPDKDEINIYYTDPDNPDTDGDGYSDWIELNNGYSPYSGGGAKLIDNDYDNDGLTDKMELRFNSDPTNPDSDGDGYSDGEEIRNGYDPTRPGDFKMEKRINIDTKNQLISYYLNDVRLGVFPVSTGKYGMETLKGEFQIIEKNPRRWSRSAQLWMPYWMMFNWQGQGIHELPEWPNGIKEGEEHLGIPVSHGCVRVGIGPAKELYDWAEIGTKIYIN